MLDRCFVVSFGGCRDSFWSHEVLTFQEGVRAFCRRQPQAQPGLIPLGRIPPPGSIAGDARDMARCVRSALGGGFGVGGG